MGDGLMATKSRPYSSRPRQRSEAPGPGEGFDAPSKSERKRLDDEQSRPYRDSYEEGRRQGRDESRRSPQPRRKPPAKRRPVPGARSARTAARQLQAPVRAQITSGMRIFGLTLAIAALYNVLTGPGPDAFSGVLGGVSKALQWLSSPLPVPERH